MADESVDLVSLVAALHRLTPEERDRAVRLAGLLDSVVQKAAIKAAVVEASLPVPKAAPKAKLPVNVTPKKRRGRKPGSKNKPKPQGQGGLTASDPVAQSLHARAEQL